MSLDEASQLLDALSSELESNPAAVVSSHDKSLTESEMEETEHRDEASSAVQSTTCQLCQLSFKRESSMLTHFKKDHDHPCPECVLKFTGEVFLEEHLQKLHNIKHSPAKTPRIRSSEKSKKAKKNDHPLKEAKRPKPSTLNREKSKTKCVAKVWDKKCSKDDDNICALCFHHFPGTDAFEKHINLDHNHKCSVQDCELSFTTENFLQLHQIEVHSLETRLTSAEEKQDHSPELPGATTIYKSHKEPSLSELDCSTCGQSFETLDEKKDHDKLHYTPEKLLSSQSIPDMKKTKKPRISCWKCKKEFNSMEESSQHKAVDHLFSCVYKGCSRAYISQPELDQHITRRHYGVADSELKGFSCSNCGDKFPNQKSLRIHHLQPHGFTCHVMGCSSKFETKVRLLHHLEAQHGIQHIKIDEQNSGFITTERSQDNIQIAEWALDWIK